uniref:Uncharacterized protein n=1 Tax=Anguilla anguilla TaxID=7936 RepID=A0A0E9PNF7_ANGAN
MRFQGKGISACLSIVANTLYASAEQRTLLFMTTLNRGP